MESQHNYCKIDCFYIRFVHILCLNFKIVSLHLLFNYIYQISLLKNNYTYGFVDMNE